MDFISIRKGWGRRGTRRGKNNPIGGCCLVWGSHPGWRKAGLLILLEVPRLTFRWYFTLTFDDPGGQGPDDLGKNFLQGYFIFPN